MAQPRSALGTWSMVDPQLAAESSFRWVRAEAPTPWEIALAEDFQAQIAGAGRMWTLAEWNAETHGTSLLVVCDGIVRHRWYADGLGEQTLFLGASMTKSLLTHLVGLAVDAGHLDLNDQVEHHVPELAESGWGTCSVWHLLTMTTGVDWLEDHRDPDSVGSRLLACFLSGDGGSREVLTEVGRAVPPGTRFAYNTGDSQVLDWVRERATGRSFLAATQDLWRRLGCAHDAAVLTSASDGVALAGGGLAASSEDWARVAAANLGHGPLSPAWIDAASVPSRGFLMPGRLPSSLTSHAGFGFGWWPLDDRGRLVTADGSRGQFAYADRDRNIVVVKTSDWPYDDWLVDRQLRDLSYLGLQSIASAAA